MYEYSEKFNKKLTTCLEKSKKIRNFASDLK